MLEGVNWSHLALDRIRLRSIVNTLMNLQVPYEAGNFLAGWANTSFSRKTLLHEVSKFAQFREGQSDGRWNQSEQCWGSLKSYGTIKRLKLSMITC